eukprot:Skav208346  [mRNA]  locus=scaffold4040:72358:77222:+ [translate_table: standard]
MLTDLSLALDTQKDFNQRVCSVFGTAQAIQVFSNYYNGKTQHRRLQWIHHLGQATIAAKLNGRRRRWDWHDLIVNSYQVRLISGSTDFP